MDRPFCGFTSESFNFFRDLARNNHKSWFDNNRERYEMFVLEPFRGLLRALESSLLNLNPDFETAGKTNGNFSRINRDIRFSKDKSPYKSNYYLYVYDRRRKRQADGRFYVGLNAECVTAGFSIYGTWGPAPKGSLETVFRRRVADHPDLIQRAAKALVRRGHYQTYWYREGKKEWAQYAGLPRRVDDWKTLQGWVVRKVYMPKARGLATPAFAKQVERLFVDLFPLYVLTSLAHPRWRAELRKAA